MIRQIVLTSFFIVLFCSCSINPRIAPGYVEAAKTLKDVIIKKENKLITPELIKSIPFASSTLSIGKGAPGLIILESVNGDQETWVSADGVYLVLEEGRIVKTRGLFNNLVSFKSVKSDFSQLINLENSETLIYYYSYDKPELIDMRVKAERKFVRTENISLLGREEQLNLIEERITNDYIGWDEVNRFWVDDDMFIWKSEQFISPKLPRFSVEVTKKPAK